MKRAGVELQSGEDGEDVRCFLIGIAGVGGCLADEFGDRRGVVLGEIKGEVERGATAVAVGVVEVAAFEFDRAEEGLDIEGAALMDGFAGKRQGVVRDELTVVE